MADSESSKAPVKPDTPRRRRLRENWKALELPLPLRPFIDYAWEDYDPKANASYLLDQAPSFYRHKSILHEGFCAWVACPGYRKLRQDGAVYRVAKALEDAETPWREGASAFGRSIGEAVGRTIGADRRFHEEVYYPIGGAMRILQAMSRQTFKRTLLEHVTDMLEAVHLMALHHYHLTHLRDKMIYHVPSKDAGAALVKTAFGASTTRLFVEDRTERRKLKPKERASTTYKLRGDSRVVASRHKLKPNERVSTPYTYKLRGDTNIVASWNQSRAAVAYAYAAASIATDAGRTLLHDIVACKSTRAKHSHLMPEWCGRARFVVEAIIERCHPEREPFKYRAQVLGVEPIPFEPPALFSFAPDIIAKGYKNAQVAQREKQAAQIAGFRKMYVSTR